MPCSLLFRQLEHRLSTKPPGRQLRLCVVVGRRTRIGRLQIPLGMAQLPLEQPLMVSPPRLRITKDPKAADDGDFVPKRSAHLAAKSKFRATKSDAQARMVLLKKLGLEEVETEKPDEAFFEEFQ